MLVGVLLLIFRDGLSDTEKENIKDIKNFRNTILAHSQSAALKKEEYEAIEGQLQNAIERLASQFDQSVIIRCNEYISTCKSGSLDINLAVKCVQQLGDSDDKFKKILDEIRSSQETSKDCQGKLDSLLEWVERISEQNLKGFCEILQELKVVKLEVEKQRSSSDGQTVAFEKDMNKIEGKIEQKISACNQRVDADVRTSVQPYDRTSDCQEITEEEESTSQEEQHGTNTYPSSTASNNFVEGQVSAGEKSSVKHIRKNRYWPSGKPIVAAIDIGTSFSGIAFSVTQGICVPVLGSYGYDYKMPTAVLFDYENVFHSFGSDAQYKYEELYEDDEHLDWYLFQNFKVKLYNGWIPFEKTIDDVNGRKMDAKKVMSAVIRYLRSKVLDIHMKNCVDVRDSDILWVLPVPVQNNSLTSFVQEAAVEAGISRQNLHFVLESEAASLYCQQGTANDVDLPLQPGTKYLVIDMGGGTVDISVCEVENTNTRVLHTYSYTDCGGTMVDIRFLGFIASITGEEAFSKFCKENKYDHLELRREFECKKRVLDQEKTRNIHIRMPVSLLETCKNDPGGKSFKEKLKESKYKEKVYLKGDRLVIGIHVLKELFTCCCQNIVRHIEDLLATRKAKGIEIVLLTGGLSNSEIIQNAVTDAFPNLKVLIPEQADQAVLRGAVMFGTCPRQIIARVFRYTYGIEITPIFDPTVHSESRRVSIMGQHRCKHVFQKFVGMGESITLEEVYCHEQTTLFPFQETITLKMYASHNKKNPQYVDEEGVEKLGSLIVNLPRREKSFINVKFRFGGTELAVTVVDLTDNTEMHAKVEFLG